MRTLPTTVLLIATLLVSSFEAQSLSPIGRWKTVDDRNGQMKSIIVIEEVGGVLRGRIDKIFSPPAPEPNPICKRCPGDKKDKPVLGMEIMWGLKKDGAEYTGGRVMDPEDGKIYKCKLRVIDGGKKLELRGYVGFSLLGRTQTWLRE